MALFPQYQITISTVYAGAALILVRAGFSFLWKGPRTNPLWAMHWAPLRSQNKLVKSRTLFSEFVKFFPVKPFLPFQMWWFSWLQLLFSCHMKTPTSRDFMESQGRWTQFIYSNMTPRKDRNDRNTACTLRAESLCRCINFSESFLLIMLTVGLCGGLFVSWFWGVFFMFGMEWGDELSQTENYSITIKISRLLDLNLRLELFGEWSQCPTCLCVRNTDKSMCTTKEVRTDSADPEGHVWATMLVRGI